MGQIKQLSITGLLICTENVVHWPVVGIKIDSSRSINLRGSERIGVDSRAPHSVCPVGAIPVVSVSGRGGSGHDVLEILGILKTVGPAYAVRALRGTAG